MSERQHASNAKLTWQFVDAMRQCTTATRENFAAWAEAQGVHLETVRRAYKGKAWAKPLVGELPDDFKQCKVCNRIFSRRVKGRLATPSLWKNRRTCGNRCHNLLTWQEVHRGIRPKRKTTKRKTVCASEPSAQSSDTLQQPPEADGHLPQDGNSGLAG